VSNVIEGAPLTEPPALGPEGRALWLAVLGAFELRDDELPVLEAAARLTDDLGRLTDALAAGPVEVEGSTGRQKANPLFAEVRLHRLALARLLQQLGLGEAELDGSARSHAARRLARMRWGRG